MVKQVKNTENHVFSTYVRLLDGPIRANRFAHSRESPDSRESFYNWTPFTRSHVIRIGFFLRIDSRESPQFALRIRRPSNVALPSPSYFWLISSANLNVFEVPGPLDRLVLLPTGRTQMGVVVSERLAQIWGQASTWKFRGGVSNIGKKDSRKFLKLAQIFANKSAKL